MSKYLKLIPVLILSFAFVFSFAIAPAYADAKDEICRGLQTSADNACGGAAKTTVNSTIRTAINLFSWAVGIASVVMIIIGGFKYVISMGDSTNINSAKNTILYAMIGLVVVAMAQVIVNFVLDKAT